MTRPPRVLLVSASAGTGHFHAAEALKAALLEEEPRALVRHVDILDVGPAWLRVAYGGGFELLASRAPRLWKELYYRTDGDTDAARWGPAAHRLLFRAFHRLATEEPWDLILATHFLPCQLAAGRPGVPPFGLVVTDFTLHRFWAQRRVGRYFVATEDLARGVRARIPGTTVDATGIPVHPKFETALSSAAARATLGLDPHAPVALVMGGGLGIGVVDATRTAAAANVAGLQVVAVTGSGERARAQLEPLALANSRVRVLGRVDRVQDYMAAADVVVTKPGGLTTSEALALGRPLILSRAIPGQEEGNAAEIGRLGAALYAPGSDDLKTSLERLFGEPGLLLRIAAAARALGRPASASTIARAAFRDLTRRAAA